MPDRKKVIKSIQCRLDLKCDECPYRDTVDDVCDDCDSLFRDALELLKEQEPIAPSVCGSKEPDGHGCWWYLCGKCKKPIDHKDRFCKRCGQAVKWDG